MIIKKMTKEDINGVEALEKECFSSPWSENSLLEELDNDTALFFVAKEENKVVGYIGANNISNEVFITNIAVTKEKRKQGVAKKLLSFLINSAKELGTEYITLEVRKSNFAAIGLYESFNFHTVGERKNFYQNPTENALLYTLYFKDEQ